MKPARRDLGAPQRDGVDAFFERQERARAQAARSPQARPISYAELPPLSYAPHPGNLPDPGEIVWSKVLFQDNPLVGKDRPVLVIGKDKHWLLGLPMTSVGHQTGPHSPWASIGSGSWDVNGRSSFVRLDQIVRLSPSSVRRVGGRLSDDVFWQVATALDQYWRQPGGHRGV